MDQCVAALTDPHIRDLVRNEIGRGISGWENVAADPGWEGIRIAYAASHPDWAGRALAELADEADADPSEWRSTPWSPTGSTSRRSSTA